MSVPAPTPKNAYESFQETSLNVMGSRLTTLVIRILPKQIATFKIDNKGNFTLTYKETPKNLQCTLTDGTKAECSFNKKISGTMGKGSLVLKQGSARYHVIILSGSITSLKAEGENISVTARLGVGKLKKEVTKKIDLMDALEILSVKREESKEGSKKS